MIYNIQVSKEIFPGFCNTMLDPDEIERYDEDDNIIEWSDEEYKQYKTNICKALVVLINQNTPFKVVDWELISPREYNYRNDELYVSIETTPEEILYIILNHEEAQEIMFSCINFEDYNDDRYHDAILEELITFELYELMNDFYSELIY